MKRWWLALVALGLVVAAAILWPQSDPVRGETTGFTGQVTRLVDDSPMAGARICVGDKAVVADEQGRYLLELAPGQYDVRVTAPDCIGMTITRQQVDGLVALDVAMVPESPSSDEREILDAKMRQLSQEPDPDELLEAQERGYTLSSVTEVPGEIRILMPDETIVVMNMDEYLKGVVPHEVSPYWHTESLRAQAIAARSYASTRHVHGDADVCTTVHCQVWSPVHYDTTDQAVDDTHGQAATYDGAIINAYFFGHCDGHTRNSEDVWGGYLDYCRSVTCPCGFDFMWGHGVGMCQEGARTMAEQGSDYRTIIAHYYTGATVQEPQPGVISDDGVTPLSGTDLTEFFFTMTYLGPDGNGPVAAHVIIDDAARPMLRVGGDAEDGWQYQAILMLAAGEHTYQFYVDDGYGNVARMPDGDVGYGPSVIAHQLGDPVPTPVAQPLGETQLCQAYASTIADWAACTLDGVDIISDGDGAVRLSSGRTTGSVMSGPISVTFPFSAIGAIWHAPGGPDDTVGVEVRTSDDMLNWSSWQTLALATDGPGRASVGESVLTFADAHALQWRATLSSSDVETLSLESLLVACLDASSHESTPLGEEPVIVSRGEWGADEALMLRPQEFRMPKAVVLHHTPPIDAGISGAAVMRSLYAWDGVLRQRGDIGANYYVDGDGVIYEGRAGGEGVVGAHSGRYDYASIGVALIDDGPILPGQEALDSLGRFLAWRCVDNAIDPHAEIEWLDTTMPTTLSACDVGLISCADDALHNHLPAIRDRILTETASVVPTVVIDWPTEGEPVRAVVQPSLSASAIITSVHYYVDGDLRATEDSMPGTWRWNTTLESDGPHALRVVVANAAGQAEATVTVNVDNTPPTGGITAPAWHDSIWAPITFDVSGASQVQFSNDWFWEGEALLHVAGSGAQVADPDASNGLTWCALAGIDGPGGWYGPYVCDLPSWDSYDVIHRLKTSDNALDIGLATLDVADDQGRRVYLQQPISALDFAASDTYVEHTLRLDYESQWPTCDEPGVDDGLEFRVWYSGAGDLWWDRVTVYTEPEALVSPYYWGLNDVEGQQRVLVRALDEAGNALEQELLIGLDRLPPTWTEYGEDWACVEDAGSGVAADDLWYAFSADGGASWSGWSELTEGIDVHSQGRVCVTIPSLAGTHVVFLARDAYGREATSQSMTIPQTTPFPSVTATPSTTVTPSPTVTEVVAPTTGATPTVTMKPTGSPTPDGTLPPPTAPQAWLPLVSRD